MNFEGIKNEAVRVKKCEEFVDKMVPRIESDGSNAYDFFCADIVGARRFARNHGGHPRSDIAEINDCASLEMKMNLLEQLQEIPVDDSNSGLNDAEIMLSHKSKYCQTPNELINYLQQQIEIRDANRSRHEEKTIDFKDEDSKVIEDA